MCFFQEIWFLAVGLVSLIMSISLKKKLDTAIENLMSDSDLDESYKDMEYLELARRRQVAIGGILGGMFAILIFVIRVVQKCF